MANSRVAHIGLSVDPKVEIVTQCEEFLIGEDDDLQVYVGTELWAHFPQYIYIYMEEVTDEADAEDTADEADDEADDEEYELEEHTTVATPVQVDLSSASPNGTSAGSGSDTISSSLLN